LTSLRVVLAWINGSLVAPSSPRADHHDFAIATPQCHQKIELGDQLAWSGGNRLLFKPPTGVKAHPNRPHGGLDQDRTSSGFRGSPRDKDFIQRTPPLLTIGPV
jgi:hypothetical protein